ncbi:M20/M25/M40 family metallo-hydrolase [Micromonospora sp. WMMD1102]|uniref:M20/M25/M40 family metallo-hydrolase n=1 Tax=Micromonospora sp. WMMD1102 TaxID=3016105 RepID=UPI002414DBA3|nr:M20/M25/M40 family metallo-hydrolase [Micromonospora sp. WMMD1102]MDG4789364.1 M20/M25/M40 family metallo-hydrolase [Micromonospora sp. WMMD1102]
MVLTAQPRLRPLPPAVATRLATVRAGVQEGRLRRHVERLDAPRGRHHAAPEMCRAESYVAGELERAGWRVRRQEFTGPGGSASGVNLLADPPAEDPVDPRRPTVLVGAHLDTAPGSPGADDNASGVACLLELARILPEFGLARPVRLAVFDQEETGLHGSRALAGELGTLGRPAAVVVFECIGFYSALPGSQVLPSGAGLLYPGQRRRIRQRGWRGDWTLVAYRQSAGRLARLFGECLTHLAGPGAALLARDALDLRLAGPLLRRYVPATEHFARSDHQPFWDVGVPAIQVTDTADFRNPHYHQPGDTPETLDYHRIGDIAAATAVSLAHLGIR